jgi:hypothetical protein
MPSGAPQVRGKTDRGDEAPRSADDRPVDQYDAD